MARACLVIPPPASEGELEKRAAWLAGRTLGELAAALGVEAPPPGARGKGKMGALLEKVLGAHAGSAPAPDFPALGVELKSIPVDDVGRPRESTFVCTISLAGADRERWETSVARAKLSRVLFVPIHIGAERSTRERRIGTALLWRPTRDQEDILRGDFDEAMGVIGAGRIEQITARAGRWLQVRPKAATSRVRTMSFGPEGEWIATVPRGFYLRASFTRALLLDPTALPG
jgi:DNA mismatch repair protein MutH